VDPLVTGGHLWLPVVTFAVRLSLTSWVGEEGGYPHC